MPNKFDGRQWILDTPGATVLWPGRVYVKSIYWKAPTTIGHTVVLQEKDGDEALTLVCEVAAESQFMLIENWWDGLILATLASGVLQVNIK